jgi:hypothetical protein
MKKIKRLGELTQEQRLSIRNANPKIKATIKKALRRENLAKLNSQK